MSLSALRSTVEKRANLARVQYASAAAAAADRGVEGERSDREAESGRMLS